MLKRITGLGERKAVWGLIVVLVALLACKKAESEDESASSDESSESDEVDDTAEVATDDEGAAYDVGDAVDVEWKGDWWKAHVLEVREGPEYFVHYDGWDNKWDEWVGPDRIRDRTAHSRSQ